jgi:glucokinase
LVPLADATIISCIATAGVVTDNAAKLTNLGNLLIDGNQMQANTSNKYLKCIQRCLVINDFVAQGKER